MQYVILFLLILAFQLTVFTNFKQFEENTQNKFLVYSVINKINRLEKKNIQLSSRKIASIDSLINHRDRTTLKNRKESVDLSEFYFTLAEKSLKENDQKMTLEYLNLIKNSSLRPEFLARASFIKVQVFCEKKMTHLCLSELDFLVSQFPDSLWTGHSLRYLSEFYQKNKLFTEYENLSQILRSQFKLDANFKSKINSNVNALKL